METKRVLEATCPECRGPLSRIVDGRVVEYRCLVDHRYSPLSLLNGHSETQERALWQAVLALEEAAVIAREVAEQLPQLRPSLIAQSDRKLEQAAAVRTVLEQLEPFTTE
jgi:two-component system chemotaxis response regulator CheB